MEKLILSAGAISIRAMLEDRSDFYKCLLDNLYDCVYFVDTDRRILYWNHAAEELTGYTAFEVIGRQCSDNILCHVDDAGNALCGAKCPLTRSMQKRIRCKEDAYLRHKDGHRIAVSVRVVPIITGEGRLLGSVEVFLDNSRRKQLERSSAELNTLAYKDTLTGVVNRRFLDTKMLHCLDELKQFGRPFCIILADVDRFKLINDLYGHASGDAVLSQVAKTLGSAVRDADTLGRWGGDEFLAIVADETSDGILNLAERCAMLVRNSAVEVNGAVIRPTISIGATVLREGDTTESWFQRADEALYRSKHQGRDMTTLIAD